jgi:hypothetical protein
MDLFNICHVRIRDNIWMFMFGLNSVLYQHLVSYKILTLVDLQIRRKIIVSFEISHRIFGYTNR